MVDSHRAMLFGGKQEEKRVSDIYIFDFKTMVSREGFQKISGYLSIMVTLGPTESGRYREVTC